MSTPNDGSNGPKKLSTTGDPESVHPSQAEVSLSGETKVAGFVSPFPPFRLAASGQPQAIGRIDQTLPRIQSEAHQAPIANSGEQTLPHLQSEAHQMPITGSADIVLGDVRMEAHGSITDPPVSDSSVRFPADWEREKRQILIRLNEVDAIVQRVLPILEELERSREGGRRSIGGNNPPEPITEPPLSLELARETSHAVEVLRHELSSKIVSLHAIHVAKFVLRQFGNAVCELVTWAQVHLDIFTRAFSESAGAEAGKWFGRAIVVTAFLTAINSLSDEIGTMTTVLENLLRSMGSP